MQNAKLKRICLNESKFLLYSWDFLLILFLLFLSPQMECFPQILPSINLRLASLSCATTTSKIYLYSFIKPKTTRRTYQLSPIPLFVCPTRKPLNRSPLHASCGKFLKSKHSQLVPTSFMNLRNWVVVIFFVFTWVCDIILFLILSGENWMINECNRRENRLSWFVDVQWMPPSANGGTRTKSRPNLK